jgi:hypothetical protein
MKEIAARVYRWIFWNILSRIAVGLFIKTRYRFSLTPASQPYPAPPFLLFANHGTFMDPWMIGYYSNAFVNYMCNDDPFRKKGFIRWYLKKTGAFPKKKGASDYKAMKETLRRLKKRMAVCIFPEGQTSWDGETQLIYRDLVKLVKLARVPVVIARLQGNFLTKPWWAHTKRNGRIAITSRIVTPEQIKTLSDDALFDTIRNGIYQNDIKDSENRKIPFTGTALAEGLERFVWICMECKNEDTLMTDGDSIRCTHCSGAWTIDPYCSLSARTEGYACLDDLKEWNEMHKRIVREKIHAAHDETVLCTGKNIGLLRENAARGFDRKGTGTLQLTPSRLVYTADAGEQPGCSFERGALTDYVIQKKDIFECNCTGDYFRFDCTGQSPMKWIYYLRYLDGYENMERRGYL